MRSEHDPAEISYFSWFLQGKDQGQCLSIRQQYCINDFSTVLQVN